MQIKIRKKLLSPIFLQSGKCILFLSLFLTIAIIASSCSQDSSSSESAVNEALQPFKVDRSSKPGDVSLFDESTVSIHSKKNKSKINDKSDIDIHDNDNDEYNDIDNEEFSESRDSSYNKRRGKGIKHTKKPKHWQKIAFENEPQISISLLRQLTTCPVPKLNLTKPTITSNVQWQIFVYCVLDILPEEEQDKKGPKKHEMSKNKHKGHGEYDNDGESSYPEIEDMRKYQSAYKFIKKSLKKYSKKYLSNNPDLTNEQKFAMFEKIFLVTKFRMLTQNEKAMVEDLIARRGLYYTTTIYRLNWYSSEFYQDHFDFSQDPQPEYGSYEIYGKIMNEDAKLVNNMKYRIPADDIYGFKTSGVSITKTSIFEQIKSFFVQEQSRVYNFHLQFYIPDNINESDQTGNTEIEIPTLVDQNKIYEMKFYVVKIANELTSNVDIILEKLPVLPPGETPPGNPASRWPDFDTTPNQYIKGLSWSLNTSGILGQCNAPGIISKNGISVVDGYAWQEFLACYLDFNISQLFERWDYFPLTSKKSAFFLMLSVKDQLQSSNIAIYKTDAQFTGLLYEAVTFQETSQSDLDLISASINKFGLEQTLNSILEKWYYSSIYPYYDYSQYSIPALTWYTFRGKIQDSKNKFIEGVDLRLYHLSGSSLAQTSSNDQGDYSFRIKIPDMMIGKRLILKANLNGYGDREIPITLTSLKSISQNIILNPLGKVTKNIGGQVISPNNEISIQIPPGAVANDKQFTISNMEIKPVPEISDSEGALFEVSPSYDFSKPVLVTISIERLNSRYPDQKSWLIFLRKDGSSWESVTDVLYNPDTKIIQAKVNHFSTVFISQIFTKALNFDNRAEVIENKTITYPTEVPSLLPYTKQRLKDGGWDPSVVDRIEFYEESGCNPKGTECKKIERNDNINEPQNDGSNITGSYQILGTANFDIQAEQCKINPLFSTPQLRLLRVSGANLSLNVNWNHTGVNISGICYKENIYIIKYWSISCFCWKKKYISVPNFYTCAVDDSYGNEFKVSNYNASFKRVSNNDPNDIYNYRWEFIDHSYKVDNNWIRLLNANSIEEDYKETAKSKVEEIAIETLKNTILTELNDKRGQVADPNFDERYCNYFDPPNIYIMDQQYYYITADPSGYNSSQLTWRSELDGEYFIKANASCDSESINLESGIATATIPVISEIKGFYLKEDLNTIHICVKRQYHRMGDKIFTIYRDDTVPNISMDTANNGYHKYVSNTGGFADTEFNWETDYNGYYKVKINAECGTTGNNILNQGSGYAIAGNPIISTINATELSEGINPINICVEARNGIIGVKTVNIFRDDTAPITDNLPIAGKYDIVRNVSLTCDDMNCLKVAYTDDGLDPGFDINGNILYGNLYTTPWTTPDQIVSVLRFRSIDKAGNIEPIKTAEYIVDTNIPDVNITPIETTAISVGDNILNSRLVWTSSRGGLEYTVRIGGSNCGNGEIIETNTTTEGENILYIPASKLSVGDNTVRVCVKNLIGNSGSIEFYLNRFENEPKVTVFNKDNEYLSKNIIGSTSHIPWHSTQLGTYEVKINGKCEDELISSAITGEIQNSDIIITPIEAAYLNKNVNIVRICVTNNYGLKNVAYDILYLDNQTPYTISSIDSGNFGSAQEIILICRDNHQCDSLIYTTDGSLPEYPDSGTLITNSPNQELTANVILGIGSDGVYTLRFRSRDLTGNIEDEQTVSINIDSNLPTISIDQNYKKYLSINGFTKTTINWYSNSDVHYVFKAGNNCTDGFELGITESDSSGDILAGENISTIINASDLDGDLNKIRICMTDNFSQSSEGIINITRDDTPPITVNYPGEGAYGVVRDVNLVCSNYCDKIIYTEDGSMPTFDGSGNGMEYTTPWPTPDIFLPLETITTLKFRAIDKAGNIENVKSAVYTIDPEVPTLNILSNQFNVVSDVPGFDKSDLLWNVLLREGLDYNVEIGLDECGSGKPSKGTGSEGKTSISSTASEIQAGDLIDGQENQVRICSQNLAGKYGFTTYWIGRNDSNPVVKVKEPVSRNFLSENGYRNSYFQWESDQYGTYEIRINNDCENGKIADGYNNRGFVSNTAPVTTEIKVADLNEGENQVYLCVYGENQLLGIDSVTFFLDNIPPVTSPSWPAGNYGSDKSIILTCDDDHCFKTFYSLSGIDPQVDMEGTILNDSANIYITPITLDDRSTTSIKYLSVDLAGNIEPVKTSVYMIDAELPSIFISVPSNRYISNVGGISSSSFLWSTDRLNLPYYIYLNSSICGSGTLYQSGTVSSYSNSVTIPARTIPIGDNTFLVCESNLVGDFGKSNTRTITRDDTPPSITTSWSLSTYPRLSITCSDSQSGCKNITYTLQGTSNTVNGSSVSLNFDSEISATLSISAQDNVGNTANRSENICVTNTCVSYRRDCRQTCEDCASRCIPLPPRTYCSCNITSCGAYYCASDDYRKCGYAPSYSNNITTRDVCSTDDLRIPTLPVNP